MVATVTQHQLQGNLTRRKLAFARALAQGASQARAYTIASPYPVTEATAASKGSRWANQPEVQAKVRELLDAADSAVSLRLAEAQRLLAETARLSPRTDPTHSERIAAIKAHADLSGWTKTEGVTVNINSVLGSLGPPVHPAIPIAPAEGVGCPNDGGCVAAMQPNPQHTQSQAFFTTVPTSPTGLAENPPKSVSGFFTNELGEMEEV